MNLTHYSAECENDMLSRLGTDADLWAREFVAKGNAESINEASAEDAIDTLRAWFANAIEAGKADEQSRDQYVRLFLGWLSGAVCELHSVEVPKLADAYEKFKENYTADAAADRLEDQAAEDAKAERVRKKKQFNSDGEIYREENAG